MSKIIDLRSDTVTQPTLEMRRAMAEAVVGDDVFGDDPTVTALQEVGAALMGKEAGLFVASGTMANQVCLGALAQPGDEVICDSEAHLLHFEGGAAAANLGLMMRPLQGVNGVITAAQVSSAIPHENSFKPRRPVVSLENTHMSSGGRVFPIAEARAISQTCRDLGVAVHLDGARLFNAQVATGIPAAEWAACADTVTFCFSKGLGAPIGSLVCSTKEIISRGRIVQRRLGGCMRQVGVIAAPARLTLDRGFEQLELDHLNAQRLAREIAVLHSAAVDATSVETNIIMVNLRPFSKRSSDVVDALEGEGIRTVAWTEESIRLVTHRDITTADIDRCVGVFKRILVDL